VFTSMLFLPVLLSLIGPHWKIHKENKSINKINEPVSEPLMIN
jgi:hypothetical protein